MLFELALVSGTLFPGGTANEFASFLAENAKKEVVVCQAILQKVPRADLEFGSFDLLARGIRGKAQLVVPPGSELILHDDLILPDKFEFAKPPVLSVSGRWVEFTSDKIRDGRVTFATKQDERLDPYTLESAKFSKPISVHWLFRGLSLSLNVENQTEQKFLENVAKAVGGVLSNKPTSYRIELDPEEFRKRTLNEIRRRVPFTLEEIKKYGTYAPELEAKYFALESFLLIFKELPRATIMEAFRTEDSKATAELQRTGELWDSFSRNLNRTGNKQFDPRTNTIRSPAGPIRINPQGAWKATISADFRLIYQPPLFPLENGQMPFIQFHVGTE